MASRVGKYLLFETLGEGAFGKVKLGVHEETGEQVAVKIMDKSDIKAQEMTMNVRREIAIMKALKHRNIVNLRCVLTSNSKLYIVMDVVTGGELFTKILNEGKLEESVARRYFQQLVDGVEYCHRRGVCHRDLKPENLLIDSDNGELKITDFGLSAMRGADTTEALLHTQCGSPNYCAPEIIARHKQGYNGAKVDAWSCGIILFALLAGFLPFYDENTKVLYRMIQKDDVKFPRRFPPSAKDLVLRLLHKEPEKRINLVDVKKHPWFVLDYAGDDPAAKGVTPVLSPTVTKRKRKGHSRRPSQDVSAIASAAASANVAAAGLGGIGSPQMEALSGATAAPPPPPNSYGSTSGSGSDVSSFGHPAYAQQQQPRYGHPVYPSYQQAYGRPLGAPPVVGRPVGIPPQPQPGQAYYSMAPKVGGAPPQYVQANPMERYQGQRASQPHPSPYGAAPGYVVDYSQAVAPPPPSYAQPPPPPAYQPPNPNRQSAPGVMIASSAGGMMPPPYAAPSPPRPQYPVAYGRQGGGEVTPSPSMELTPPLSSQQGADASETPSSAARGGGFDNVPSYASLSAGMNGASSMKDVHTRAPPADAGASSYFPPPPPFPGADAMDDDTDVSAPQTPVSPPTSHPPRTAVPHMSPATTLPSAVPVVAAPPKILPDSAWQKPSGAASALEGTRFSAPAPVSVASAGSTGVVNSTAAAVSGASAPAVSLRPASMPVANAALVAATCDEGNSADDDGPVSMVERRRLMFNQMAGESSAPAPIPHKPRAGSTPVVPPPVYPGAKTGNGPTDGLRLDDRPERVSPWLSNEGPSVSNESDSRDGERTEETGNTSSAQGKATADGFPMSIEEVPQKKRLAAALARYRRIFLLRNSVGITTSPSFGSNSRGPNSSFLSTSAGSVQAGDSDPRADFFARAKAVTGAWGVILTQELDDLDDSDDETVVKESELEAFGKLLDFWDGRKAVARQTGNVVLDDHEAVPLTEEEIANIQSLLSKLEPNAVDTVEEIEDTAHDGREGNPDMEYSTGDGEDHAQYGGFYGASGGGRGGESDQGDDTNGLLERDFSDLRIDGGDQDEGNNTSNSGPPSGNAAIPPNSQPGLYPRSPLPPGDSSHERMRVSESTLRDPFRPGLPPYYPGASQIGPITTTPLASPATASQPGPASPAGAPLPSAAPHAPPAARNRRPNVSFDNAGAFVERSDAFAGAADGISRIPGSKSVDAELNTLSARRDTTHSGSNGAGSDGRRSRRPSREQPRVNSSVSGHSDDSNSRHSARDFDPSVAQKGMFGFGAFARRPAVTSFDCGLEPHRCLVEVGRILAAMGCHVMMKKGESKMKCEVPLQNKDKMLVSITCVRISGISTVAFKRGRKDRSRADNSEFHDLVETVSGRFASKTRTMT